MSNYDYNELLNKSKADYERRNGLKAQDPLKADNAAMQAEQEPIMPPPEESSEKKEAVKKPEKKSSRKSSAKQADPKEKRIMNISIPVDVYIGLKTLAAQNLTNVSSLICDMYYEKAKAK